MTTPLRDGAVSGNVLMAKVEPNSGTVQYLFGPTYVLLGIDPEVPVFRGKAVPGGWKTEIKISGCGTNATGGMYSHSSQRSV